MSQNSDWKQRNYTKLVRLFNRKGFIHRLPVGRPSGNKFRY